LAYPAKIFAGFWKIGNALEIFASSARHCCRLFEKMWHIVHKGNNSGAWGQGLLHPGCPRAASTVVALKKFILTDFQTCYNPKIQPSQAV
jgi:hypothetical protein